MKVYTTLVLLLAVFMSANLYADSTSSSTISPNKASASDSNTKNNEASALTDADKKPADPELLKKEAGSVEEEPLVNDTVNATETTNETKPTHDSTNTATSEDNKSKTTEETESDEEDDDEPDEDDC